MNYADLIQKISVIAESEGWHISSNWGDDQKMNIELVPKVVEQEIIPEI